MAAHTFEEKLKKLSLQVKISENVESMCSQVLRVLKDTDYKAMNSFKPFINPKQNIAELLEFYERYTNSLRGTEKIRIKIEQINFLDPEKRPKIKEMEQIDILGMMEEYKEHVSELDQYKEVKIVETFQKESLQFYDQVVESIKRGVFNALNRLPKIVARIDLYAQFLLKNANKKLFLSDYTQQVYKKLGFFGITNNFAALVQQTSNLTKYFNLIVHMNAEILGNRAAHNINVGLVQLIIINLKKVIADTLLKVDKENKVENVPWLIKLHKNLKHSEGPKIAEIEELFVFKEEIKKLILNCLIQFFADLELLESPRNDLKAEEICCSVIDILDAFNAHEKLKNEWVSSFGPSFGVYKPEELNSNISNKCLIKVSSLSLQLKDFDKFVYLINNKHIFVGYIDKFENMTIKKSINKDVQLIVGLWKIKLEAYKGLVLNRYLAKQLPLHQKYTLPNEERKAVQEALIQIVENMIARKVIEGQTKYLKDSIEKTYTDEEKLMF
ncbi:hypothetical protein NUSPORA_01085 [Nucleospora cyclopteri]